MESDTTVRVYAPSRLHFGLVAVSNESRRVFGGCGLAIWHVATEVEAHLIPRGLEIHGVEGEERIRILNALQDFGCDGVSITAVRRPPRHHGFGSGTALRLAALEAAMVAGGKPQSKPHLIRASGRGGASGIGVATYFIGGLVGDWGHRRMGNTFLPSAAAIADFIPPSPAFRIAWPRRWPVAVAYPHNYIGLSGDDEVAFMKNNTPLSLAETALSALSLLFEVPAAVKERDFAGFRSALIRSRSIGFKKREIGRLEAVSSFIEAIDGNNHVTGTMSSFGPAVLIAADSANALKETLALIPGDWIVLHGRVAAAGRVISIKTQPVG